MSASTSTRLDQLESQLDYRFGDRKLLCQALVHGSYLNEAHDESLQSNERLEFLGDAILGAVVARRLFLDFPDAGEGWMTVARSQLVRNRTLGHVGRDIGLGQCLLMGAGVDNEGARDRLSVLGRAMEAILGAVWLDGGDDAARTVIQRLLGEHLNALEPKQMQSDAKSQLQHVTQSRSGAMPAYAITEQSGPPHDPSFRAKVELEGAVLAEGTGRSKQAAEMDAARSALRLLQEGGD